MKKILSFFAAMLVAVAANAAVININTETTDALRKAVASASTGDVIVMAAGTYEESASDYIAFHGKEVTVMAAEGAEVIVKTSVPIRLKTGGRAEFIGIKFDCSALTGYGNLIVPADDSENKRVILNNCEFYSWVKNSSMIQSTSSRRLDSIVIDNCYFHNCEKCCVFVENTNLVGLKITNSTFANIAATTTSDYWAAPISVKATSGKVVVDHCTFYNVATMSLSYGVVTVDALADAMVSNCIFMLPATADKCATNLPEGATVKNTLTYNYDNWQPYGHFNTATVIDCVKADPKFVNAAEGNFNLGEGSPALTLNDGEPIGDPRWWPAPAAKTTLYCKMTQSWWTADGAAVGIYAWDGNGSPKVTWPGERMTPVEGEEGVWSFELDTDTYKNCIFTRVNGNGAVSDWGAKTKDLTIPTDGKNLFTITNTTAVWGDPGCDGEWSVYGATPLAEAPDAAPAAPTWPANQVKAVYSATYNADCGFGEWGSGTAYEQGDFGKKYVTTNLGYFGLTFEDNALNCTSMEKLHIDIWIAADASVRVVPIWNASANIGVTLNLEGQKWNSFDIALSEFDGVPDWSNIYQIKIDEARELTFWVNNVFFYTTVAPEVDEVAPTDFTAVADAASYFSAKIKAKATDNSGAVEFDVINGELIVATVKAASEAETIITVKNLAPNTEYNFSVVAKDESGNAAEPIAVATKTLEAPAAAPAPVIDPAKVKSIYSDAYEFAPASLNSYNEDWWSKPDMVEGELAEGDKALFYAKVAEGMIGWQFGEIDVTDFPFLHIDIYPLADGSIMIYPVDNIEPKQEYKETYEVKGGKWNNLVIDMSGKDLTKIFQIGWINYVALNGFFIDNVFYSSENTVPEVGTAIDNTAAAVKAQKVIMNGQLFIIREGEIFNAQGQIVR